MLLIVVYRSWLDPELTLLCSIFATFSAWLLIDLLKIWRMLVYLYELLFVPRPIDGATFDSNCQHEHSIDKDV